ncbi:hypothetical protein OKA05_06885 [Luteolibacter arcticus]|uniref:Lipoprotein n=1 Tax=Luteolibacter arcticus TaxID=1581411 RepID=A0ABT3GF75_9BACT|nr:hypothetical protein [Luteolibacter arcticus]MCW1922272.1 hypothetical protein [Luteolibacter arcticus]
MESPPTGPGRTLIMTRAGAIGMAAGLICMSFMAGWIVSRVGAMRMVKAQTAAVEAQHADKVKELREYASVPMFTGPDGDWVSPEAGLKKFEPSPEDSVTLSHTGGLGGIDRHIKITGDGAVTVSDSSGTKQVNTLSKAACADYFRKVISSGLAGYSEEAVQLKRDLAYPETTRHVTCAGDTRFRVLVPQLKVNRDFSICLPEIESQNFPDIIEYRSAVEIEKEILGLVP